MSENTNIDPEELTEEITYTVEDANVIPTPIDPTLSIAGEAADAKATGDAIAAIAAVRKVNNQTPDANGAVVVYGSQVYVSNEEGAQTLNEAIEAVEGRSAEDILYDPDESDTVAEIVGGIITAVTDGVTDDEIDDTVDTAFEEDEEE